MRKVAMLVANDTFPKDASLPPLRFAHDDASALADVLSDKESCGFDTTVYHNCASHTILNNVEKAAGELGAEDTLLFYYAGHGKLRRNGKLFLATDDTSAETLSTTAIGAEQILDLMRESRAQRRVLILDCCHSGAIGGAYRSGDLSDTLGGLAQSFGSYILTASTAIQLAEERETEGHGVFTHALIEGLRTGEAAKQNKITISDLHEYACARLAPSSPQTPLLWALKQAGPPLLIADFSKRRAHEEREQIERLLACGRAKFDSLVAGGHIRQAEADGFIRILSCPEADLLPHERHFRPKVIAYLDGKIGLFQLHPEDRPSVTAPSAREPSQSATPPDAGDANRAPPLLVGRQVWDELARLEKKLKNFDPATAIKHMPDLLKGANREPPPPPPALAGAKKRDSKSVTRKITGAGMLLSLFLVVVGAASGTGDGAEMAAFFFFIFFLAAVLFGATLLPWGWGSKRALKS